MVFRPTPEARQFVECWKQASESAPYGEIDQSSQVVAMAELIGTTFVPLPLICNRANPDEKGKVQGVVIQHDLAGRDNFPKVSGWKRYVRRVMGRRSRPRSGLQCAYAWPGLAVRAADVPMSNPAVRFG